MKIPMEAKAILAFILGITICIVGMFYLHSREQARKQRELVDSLKTPVSYQYLREGCIYAKTQSFKNSQFLGDSEVGIRGGSDLYAAICKEADALYNDKYIYYEIPWCGARPTAAQVSGLEKLTYRVYRRLK